MGAEDSPKWLLQVNHLHLRRGSEGKSTERRSSKGLLRKEKRKDTTLRPQKKSSELYALNMPFVSRAQEKWAFSTHQPWAKKWAGMTEGKKLPNKVKKSKGKRKSKKYNFAKAEKKLGIVQR